MPRDGGGTYTLPAGNPVIPGTIIETTWANPTMSDIGAALTDSLSRTGSGGMLVPFQNADGSVSLPGITWSNQQNMGFYRPNLDEMRVSVAAVDKARWTSDANDPMDIFVGGMWVAVLNEGGSYALTGDWDFSGANSFIGPNPFIISGADAAMSIRETGGTADEGVWNLRANDDKFVLASATDGAPLTDVENAFEIARVGTAIGPWTFRGGQYDFSDVAASRLLQLVVDGSGVHLTATVGGLDLDAVAASVNLFQDGTLRALTALNGTFRVLSDGNTDTEKRMIQLEDSSGNVRGEWGWTNTEARMHLENFVNGQDFELRGRTFGGNPRTFFFADPDAETTFLYGGDLPGIGAQDRTAAGASTGGVVVDSLSNPFPVGFNVIPGRTISTNQTMDDDNIGRMWEKGSGGAITITLPNDTNIPQGATIMIANIDSENMTINPGGGVTLTWFDGAGGQVGGRTVAQGAVVTIRKANNTNFQIWGNGIT